MNSVRVFRAFGNLNNGSEHAGLSCVNGNNTVSNVNWNYAGRPATGRTSYMPVFTLHYPR